MSEILTCYECSKIITETDKPYYDDADLCKKCYYDRDDVDGPEED